MVSSSFMLGFLASDLLYFYFAINILEVKK